GFTALDAGAHGLKIFPAEMCPPPVVKAWLAVFPKGTKIIPVGGVGAHNIADFMAVGAAGAGIGSSLFKPGDKPEEVQERAAALVKNAK
ncbi:2-dehydro-3-deoxy-6-phosphogalactonate aldolase, partial [Rhodobacteraceae bacterium RKSG542]|nr:2-dehydro-3-deoxy-6-phosphogalactonate aldolase [Pseudovibrio flavus]